MNRVVHLINAMLPLAVTIICVHGIIYHVVHQYIRLSANEIPLQFAENARTKLEKGVPAVNITNSMDTVDMHESLSTFVMITDKTGHLLASSAVLHGRYAILPPGALMSSKQNGENRVTWQPERGTRVAAVILPWSVNGREGYIIGGRSLRETEKRMQFILFHLAGGLIVTLLVTFLCTLIVHSKKGPAAAM